MATQPAVMLDYTVILDGLIHEHVPDQASSAVLRLTESGRIRGLVSAAAIEPIYDLLAKERGRRDARKALQRLCATLVIAPLDEGVIDLALSLGCHALDDAITAACARRSDVEWLVTLNAEDMCLEGTPVVTPEELLEQLDQRPRLRLVGESH